MSAKGGLSGPAAPSIVYGPVASWRLGRSLGIDLLPGRGKTCCFDCVYCQLGITTNPRGERGQFVSLEGLAQELKAAMTVPVDCVTFSGTGEPALAANLGAAIDVVRSVCGLPVAVLTNSALMTREDVRRDMAKADIVVAKLDAPDERLFRLINRPLGEYSITDIIAAIKRFRSSFSGRLALQMMFMNGNKHAAREMAAVAEQIDPDEVQLNTPLRRCPVAPLPNEELDIIRAEFRGIEGVVTAYDRVPPDVKPLSAAETRRRRPESSLR
ncbi:MAG: radical SAM protein [Dehalococcoidia bacterium]|nr:radical SAM protein [Dehalococcoidia bacterium]